MKVNKLPLEIGKGGLTSLLLNHLNSQDSLPPFRQYLSPDRPDWVYISSLPTFCERKERIIELYPEKREHKDAASRIILDIGSAVHTMMQQHLGKAGIIYGNWRCSRCYKEQEGFYPSRQCECSRNCEQPLLKKVENNRISYSGCIWPQGFNALDRDCRSCPRMNAWEFRETRVEFPEIKLVGKYDGLIRLNEDYILEIKTIGTKAFEYLKDTVSRHKIQSRTYQYLESKRLGKKLKGIALYVDKGGSGEDRNPFKEFIIEPDDAQVEEVFARLKFYWAKKTALGMFPRKLCANKTEGKKMYCHCIDPCFDKSLDLTHGVIQDE